MKVYLSLMRLPGETGFSVFTNRAAANAHQATSAREILSIVDKRMGIKIEADLTTQEGLEAVAEKLAAVINVDMQVLELDLAETWVEGEQRGSATLN